MSMAVMAADGEFLAASTYEGKPNFGLNGHPTEAAEMKFKLIRQADGTSRPSDHYRKDILTALSGGGQVEKYDRKYWTPGCGGLFGGPCIGGSAPIFHTDATQVQAWEKFRLVDQGNCTYTIQTTSGFFAGIFKDSSGITLLTTTPGWGDDAEREISAGHVRLGIAAHHPVNGVKAPSPNQRTGAHRLSLMTSRLSQPFSTAQSTAHERIASENPSRPWRKLYHSSAAHGCPSMPVTPVRTNLPRNRDSYNFRGRRYAEPAT